MNVNFLDFVKTKYLALIVLFFAFTGFFASFYLTYEKIEILKNPNKIINCSINPFLNCDTVMKSSYAEFFGIPWSLFGVAGYCACLLLGLFLLNSYKINKYISWILTFGSIAAFVLSLYFMLLSAYVIKVFCPWCILSAISSSNIFFAILTINTKEDNYNLQLNYYKNLIKKNYNIYFILLFYLVFCMIISYPFIYGL